MNSDRPLQFRDAAIVTGSILIAPLAAPTSLLAQGGMKPPLTAQFMEKHCADCHDNTTRKAGLHLLDLGYRSDDSANLAI